MVQSLTLDLLTSIANPHDSGTWDRMAGVKSNIFRRWDTASGGIRVCCIKFVQRVVQVQTPGVIADPRVRWPRAQTLKECVTDRNAATGAERGVRGISSSRSSIDTTVKIGARGAWLAG